MELKPYLALVNSRRNLVLDQIAELYHARCIDLKTADELARKYTDAQHVDFEKRERNGRS